jgi:UDP-glucose 4-epimerase
MKILVTGGAGYIGSHTTNQLLAAGHEVVVFDNLSTGFRDAVSERARFVLGDVRDSETVSKVMIENDIEAVVHFAAKLIVSESIHQPIEYYENNTLGVLSLMKVCRVANIKKVVFSSTAAVYGDSVAEGLVEENSPIAPLNPYGTSKFMSEEILRDCDRAYGIRSVILRYFNVAGASLDGKNGQRTKNATHLIKVASETAVGKRLSMDVYGTDYPTHDGTCIRDYIHVEDLAELHVLGLAYLEAGGKTDVFNCGYGKGFSVREVVETVKRVSLSDFRIHEKTRRDGDAASLVASCRHVTDVFSWIPKHNSLEVVCRSAVNWEKKLTTR